MYIIKQIVDINNEIQKLEINLKDYKPYYPLPDKLNQLFNLMTVDTGNQNLNKHISSTFLPYLKNTIAESQNPIPDHIEDKEEYKKLTVQQMKRQAQRSLIQYKNAYISYYPHLGFEIMLITNPALRRCVI